MKKRLWKIIVAVIVIAVAAVTINIIYTNNNDSYIYKITYRDEFIPGATYLFYITENYDVKATKMSYCTTAECIESGNASKEEKYTVKISDENKEMFKLFIQGLFKLGQTEIELSSLYIADNEELIFNVLKYDNEEYFKYYESKK